MTVNATQYSQPVHFQVKTAASAYIQQEKSAEKTEDSFGQASEVSVSREGQLKSELLEGLPPLVLDPEYHLQNAEKELDKMLKQFGISSDEDIEVTVNSRGEVQISGESPMIEALQARISEGEFSDFTNSMRGAQSASVIRAIGEEVVKAMQLADEFPNDVERIYENLRTKAQQIKNYSMQVSFNNGSFGSASLMA